MHELEKILKWMVSKIEEGFYAEDEIELAVEDLLDEVDKL